MKKTYRELLVLPYYAFCIETNKALYDELLEQEDYDKLHKLWARTNKNKLVKTFQTV